MLLSDQELDIIQKIQQREFPEASVDPYPVSLVCLALSFIVFLLASNQLFHIREDGPASKGRDRTQETICPFQVGGQKGTG